MTNVQIQAAARAYLNACQAVAETIRELGEVPSGELYARLMSVLDIATYERIIGTLKGAGVVAERGNLLKWTGPVIAEQAETAGVAA